MDDDLEDNIHSRITKIYIEQGREAAKKALLDHLDKIKAEDKEDEGDSSSVLELPK